jgi:exopolysaccharide biosynthesis polyprenyl glycosylphosphotransferase
MTHSSASFAAPAGRTRRSGRTWALFITDAACLAGAAVAARVVRTQLPADWFTEAVQPLDAYLGPVVAGIVLCLGALVLARLYEDRRYLSRLEEYVSVVKAVTYATLVGLAIAFVLKDKDISRAVVLLYWAFGCVFLVLARSGWHQRDKARRRRGEDALSVAVVCERGGLPRVRALLRRFPELGYRINASLEVGRGTTAGQLRRLAAWAGSGRVDAVLVGVSSHRYHRVVPYLAWCEEHAMPHHRLTGAFDAFHGTDNAPGDLPPVDSKPVYTAVKRMFDEIAGLVIFVLTSPLWFAVAIAIKLDSPGPVFFIQDRVGRHGRIFRCLKFRTMYAHAPRYALTARSSRDPRVTPVGRLLRRTSLDELPQLLNVIRGEMSLVGPRPEMPFMVRRNTPMYQRRLMVLPGLTGLWQAVARHEPLEESLRYDLYYIQHRSFVFDLVILARTGLSVLAGHGAF